MKYKKLIVLLLTFIVIFSQISVYAITSQDVKKQIEDSYKISIRISDRALNESSEEDMLFFYKSLQASLRNIGEDFLKELIQNYKSRSIDTEIYFNFSYWGYKLTGDFRQNNNKAIITMGPPPPKTRNFVLTHVLAHEFGHMINVDLDYKLGYKNVRKDWDSIEISDEATGYVSDYAKKSYREDFAEVFSHISSPAKKNRQIRFLLENPDSAVEKKIDYMNEVLIDNYDSYEGLKSVGFFKPKGPSNWSKDTIKTLISKEELPGYYEYKYQGSISRIEFCELVIRMILDEYGLGNDLEDFDDYKFNHDKFYDISRYNSMSYFQIYSVNKAYNFGIINGKSENYFYPHDNITREEAAVILKSTVEYLSDEDFKEQVLAFKDKEDISSWPYDAVEFVKSSGIMKGTGNSKFEPKGRFTYEQTYTTIDRIKDLYK
jgi:hypothetical protein